MNVFDTLLLANITIVCYLLSREYVSDESTGIIIVLLMPATILGLFIIY